MAKFVVGVIGAGRIGKLHTNNLKNLSNVRVKTIADPYINLEDAWFKTCGVENITKDYKEIINVSRN